MALEAALQQQFGFSTFRQGQKQTIEQLLAGHSTLAIFPTGSGKSLCYQFTALQLSGLTLVVSPLLALMQDQIQFLNSKGIPAASIDSSLSPQQNQQIMQQVRSGELKILMVSVERFKNERFRQFIRQIKISMLVVDEAHCISEWGHNFRPDYLKLPQYRQQLNIPLVLLLTATATENVKLDMAEKFAIATQDIVQTGFYRPNLNLQVIAVNQQEKNTQLVKQINQLSGHGIVYVTLQNTAEQVADFLVQQGIQAQAYHAGMNDDARKTVQHEFMNAGLRVVVATIAFGMGVDKSDIRFVIHYDLPKSIENYSQEIGRSGRDGELAHCICLASLDGLTVMENFIYGDTPEPPAIALVIDDLAKNTVNNRWEIQLTSLSNACNIRQLPLKTLLVQLELYGVIEAEYAYFAEYKYKFLIDEAMLLAGFNDERQAFLRQIFSCTQFKKIWGELDVDNLVTQHGAERTRVLAALEYLHEKSMIELQAKQMTDVYRIKHFNSSDIQPLVKQLATYFSDKETKEINRLQQMVQFFQSSHCLSAALSHYFSDMTAPAVCGHCSVCAGKVATLSFSTAPQLPDDSLLMSYLAEFSAAIVKHQATSPSTVECSRFLSGTVSPKFSRLGVKKINGFASCTQVPFSMIKQKVEQLPVD